jgi:phage gpG-like protein
MEENNKIFIKIINDLRVDLADEFDKNFERKAFFNDKWQDRQRNGKGSLLLVSGKLRRSIRSKIEGESIIFSSSEPYAKIHNEGGEITVTPKMKKYFWAKYCELSGKVKYKKDGTKSQSKRASSISDLALWYKSMALKKTGSKIKIPKRQFIGFSNETNKIIEKVLNNDLKEIQTTVKHILKTNKK